MPAHIFIYIVWFILLLVPSKLKSQSTCVLPEKSIAVSPQTSQLLQGNFLEDSVKEIALVESGKVLIANIQSGNLIIKDSIVHSTLSFAASPGDIDGDGFNDLIVNANDSLLVYAGTKGGMFLKNELSNSLGTLLQRNTTLTNLSTFYFDDLDKDNISEVFVFARSGSNLLFAVIEVESGQWKIRRDIEIEFYGGTVSGIKNLGDINKDGYNDIGFYSSPAESIHIYYGGADYFNEIRSVTLFGPEIVNSLEVVGDVNKDGYLDILSSGPQLEYGDEAAVLFLGTSEYNLTRAWSTSVETYRESQLYGFGSTSGPMGDINNDGYDDFFVGGNGSYFGKIFYGNIEPSNIQSGGKMIYDLSQIQPFTDLNNDGYNEYISLFPFEGRYLSILTGVSHGIRSGNCFNDPTPFLKTDAKYGKSAGDVNGDGFGDIVIGNDQADPSGNDEMGYIIVIRGAFSGTGVSDMGFGTSNTFFGEQFGSGDFNNDGYTDVVAGLYGRGQVLLFYGDSSGMKSEIDHILQKNFGDGWGEWVEAAGDVNGDGFDDFLSFNSNTLIVYGTDSVPYIEPGWSAPGYYSFKAGDVNGDGFHDFYVLINEGYQLYYGSSGNPFISSFISQLPMVFAGDINHDGFDDALQSDAATKSVRILFGSSDGPGSLIQIIPNVFAPNGIGDFNGDGYDDIAVSSSEDKLSILNAPDRVDVFLGSSNGIQPVVFKTFRGNERMHNLRAQPRAGDFNNDGNEELLVSAGFEVWMFKGSSVPDELQCRKDTTIYSDSTCFAEVKGFMFPSDFSTYTYTITGATDLKGKGSINGIQLHNGQNYVTYIDEMNPSLECRFTISVLDTIAPKLKTSPSQLLCSGTAKAPELLIKDECGIKSISYTLTGATGGSGIGKVVSNKFNQGTTIITWTVMDSSDNISTSSTSVSVLDDLGVRIFPAYQVNKQQSDPNTIYTGYANNSIRISAWQANSSKFTYRWSTGDTTRYLRIRQAIPGTYLYSVVVTNESGCHDTASTTITVKDNYCPDPLKDLIYTNWRSQLNNPLIQSLLLAISKVNICKDGTNECVPASSVQQYISAGARLGECEKGFQFNNNKTIQESIELTELVVTVSPNPSKNQFHLSVSGTGNRAYTIKVYNNNGSLVFQKNNQYHPVQIFGENLLNGVYFCEISTMKQRKTFTLIKTR